MSLTPRYRLTFEVTNMDGKQLALRKAEIPWEGATFIVPRSVDRALLDFASKQAREVMRDAIYLDTGEIVR